MRGWESTKVLPPKLLKMLPAKDRAEMGKAGQLPEEIDAKNAVKLEKELHRQVLALLQEHRGICVLYSRSDRKSTCVPGTPDLVFAVGKDILYTGHPPVFAEIFACGWELKVGNNKQDPDQVEMQRRLETPPNA